MRQILSLVTIPLLAQSLNASFYDEVELRQDYVTVSAKNPNEDIKKTFGKSSLNYMFSYNNDLISFDFDGELYNLNQDEPTIQKNVSLAIDQDRNYTLRSALLGLKITDEITLYAGVIPFRGGRFASIKNERNNTGNGIELLTDQVFEGGFISYNKGNFSFQIGHVEFKDKYNYRSLGAKNNGSNGQYFITKYNNDKHYIEFNYFKADAYMAGDTDSPFKFANYDLYGLGYIYDDSKDSGITYWIEGSYSEGKEDTDKIAADNVPAEQLPFLAMAGYKTGMNNSYGGSYKTGIAYSSNYEDIEYKVGVEYYESMRGSFTMNHGVLFHSNYSYWQHKNANMVTLFTNIRLNRYTYLYMDYSKSHNPEIPHYFSPTSSNNWNVSNVQNTGYTNHERFNFSISLRF